MKKYLIYKLPRLFLSAIILALLASVAIPSPVLANTVTYSVRFTASYVSGNTGTKNVYYILDGGSAQLLGTVSSATSLDVTFNATFTSSIRVYVEISDDAIYNEYLYFNGNLQTNGSVGNGGLSYSRGDTTPPSGRIVTPIYNAVITKCPMMVVASVGDDSSGVQWVIYNVKYDGTWHQLGTDNSSSGAAGWSTAWDCSNVADQAVEFAISAMDNAGNQGNLLGGIIHATLAKEQPTQAASPTPVPVQPSSTSAPSATAIQPQVTSTVEPSLIPTQPLPTATILPTQTVQSASLPEITSTAPAAGPPSGDSKKPALTLSITPGRTPVCSAVFAPMFVGLGFMVWKKRTPNKRA